MPYSIGAPYNDFKFENAGQVRLYTYDGNNWIQVGNDINGESKDDFFYLCELNQNGSHISVGSPFNDLLFENSGYVRNFYYKMADLSIQFDDLKLKEYHLSSNYPNPFNSETKINIFIPKKGDVSLVIYNTIGQKIKEYDLSNLNRGYNLINWNSTDQIGNKVVSGIYIYELNTENFSVKNKMLLIK